MADRVSSDNPDVHRELIVQDPPQDGRDIANFQRAIQDRLKARGLSDEVPVPIHGKFTHATWIAAVEAGYFLGLLSSTYLATDKKRGLSTEGAQTIIRNPDQRDNDQLVRAKDRKSQLDRGPRYYDNLAQFSGITKGKGAKAALDFAVKQIGITENPAGSNWGPKISDWIKLTGYSGPVYWCGCFTNACVMAGGLSSTVGWGGYCPAVITHAKNKIGGWSWHVDGQPGDLALMDTPGGDPAIHIGIVEKKLGIGRYQNIEGNTSSGDGGNQSNGGGVFRRQRSTQGNFRIVGFARPPWPA
jgi:hypothetical protein